MKAGKISGILLWSVISAAFIGPGTLTTAISAGSAFQLDLLWVVTFALISCIIIQELAARITISTGMNMGEAMVQAFGQNGGRLFRWLTGWIVVSGCAAYEAGNIIGAVSGLRLATDIHPVAATGIISLLAFVVLWNERPRWISNVMISLLLIMGLCFVGLAMNSSYSLLQVASSFVTPSFPAGSSLIVIGLIGTTLVPYNIFLGSGISRGQTLSSMRIGLPVSVIMGGLITTAIVVSGSAIENFSSFGEVKDYFESSMGPVAVFAFSAGLFAAGFSSAVMAPFAASLIAVTVFQWDRKKARWMWVSVLGTGFIFGVPGFRPVPAILMVQAMNGLILPLLVFLTILMVNSKSMPEKHRPGILYTILLVLILSLITMIGLNTLYGIMTGSG